MDSEFLIRHRKYDSAWGLPFSGNLSADTTGANGNVRFVHEDRRPEGNVGDDYVLSVDTKDWSIYWGVSWSGADNFETFFFFDPDSMGFDGQIEDGAQVIVRSMTVKLWNFTPMFWQTQYGLAGSGVEPRIRTVSMDKNTGLAGVERFTIEKVV
jgi:hypothetical protein